MDLDHLFSWYVPAESGWNMTINFESDPLNINLIIPFKDNKQAKQKLFIRDIERFKLALEREIESIKSELDDLLGSHFELSIVARSDGNAKKYYWRFKSSKRDRKFNRLASDTIRDYLDVFSSEQKRQLFEIERSIIFINANLKLVKAMLDAISQSNEELNSLLAFNF